MSNILIISPNFPPANKISSLRLYYLTLFLKEKNQVTVMCKKDEVGGLNRSTNGLNIIYFNHLLEGITFIKNNKGFDKIISSYGPTSAHILGYIAKKMNPQAFWLADYRDLWMSGNYYTEEKQNISKKIKILIEKIIIKESNEIVTVSNGLAKNLEEFHKRKVHVIYNGYEESIPINLFNSRNNKNQIKICYTGTIYKERSIETLLNILLKLKLENIDIKLIVVGTIDDNLLNSYAEYILKGVLDYRGKVEREESYLLQAESDILLMVEDYEASLKGVMTGKIFEYISNKKPIILMGVSPISEVARLVMKTGLLLFCGTDLEIFYKKIIKYNKIGFDIYQIDHKFIESLDRKIQVNEFLKLLDIEL